MNNDRELLELAAKAAGIELAFNDDGSPGRFVGYWRPKWIPWNPRDDDGDSRRLEVDLNIEVRFHLAGSIPGVTATVVSDSRLPVPREPWGSDKRAATRLAVLRAAAEIGRAMP
ncbi:MAG: hypothetical protein WAW73_20280 [Rhodoferax sp.]